MPFFMNVLLPIANSDAMSPKPKTTLAFSVFHMFWNGAGDLPVCERMYPLHGFLLPVLTFLLRFLGNLYKALFVLGIIC